jgi:hypothetical protein
MQTPQSQASLYIVMYGVLSPSSAELGIEYGEEIREVRSYFLPSVGNDVAAVRGLLAC